MEPVAYANIPSLFLTSTCFPHHLETQLVRHPLFEHSSMEPQANVRRLEQTRDRSQRQR